MKVWDEAAAFEAEPERPPPNPPPYGLKPPPWLKVWDEAPALAAAGEKKFYKLNCFAIEVLSIHEPDPPNPPPNCGAARAAAISAKMTTKNFMIKRLIAG